MSALTLGQMRTAAQERADMRNTGTADETQRFIPDSEWNSYVNASAARLYGIIVTHYQDYRVTSTTFASTGVASYDLPTDLFKARGLELQWNAVPSGWITLTEIPFANRNDIWYPVAPSWANPTSCRYFLLDSTVTFAPPPQGTQTFRLWYVPLLPALSADSDTLDLAPVNGWEEWIVNDVAAKALAKEESHEAATHLMQRNGILEEQLRKEAPNRNIAGPKHVSRVRDDLSGAGRYGWGWGFGR